MSTERPELAAARRLDLPWARPLGVRLAEWLAGDYVPEPLPPGGAEVVERLHRYSQPLTAAQHDTLVHLDKLAKRRNPPPPRRRS